MGACGETMKYTDPFRSIDIKKKKTYKSRTHLGLSQAGHPCDKWAWKIHHGETEPAPGGRIQRLFRSGDDIEMNIIQDLLDNGRKVTDTQQEVELTSSGVTLFGHIDGIYEGKALLEIKSCNTDQYTFLKRVGYENWNAKYKFQIHAYAYALELDDIVVAVENKNNSKRHWQHIKLNKYYVESFIARRFEALAGDEPAPIKIKECKYCSFKCFENEVGF